MDYTLEIRKTYTVAFDFVGNRLGSFDRTAGAARGTIRGRIVATDYREWLKKLDELEV